MNDQNAIQTHLNLETIEKELQTEKFHAHCSTAYISIETFDKLIELIPTNNKIEYFSLCCCHNGLNILALFEALKENKTIKEIKILDSCANHDCANALAELLKTNITIKYIKLSAINFNNEDGQLIADALEENYSITTMYLEYTEITDKRIINQINAYTQRNKDAPAYPVTKSASKH